MADVKGDLDVGRNLTIGGTLEVAGPSTTEIATASTTAQNTVSNTDNTSVTSHADHLVKTGGTSGGDPTRTLQVTSGSKHISGLDNSDSDKYKETFGAALATTPHRIVTASGEQTLPLQTSFSAYVGTTLPDVTGDGTIYGVPFNTEDDDQGSNYSTSTGLFTAPVPGLYLFTSTIYLTGIGVTYGFAWADFVASGTGGQRRCAHVSLPAGNIAMNIARQIKMAAGDTCGVSTRVGTVTKIVDVNSDSFFAGYLLG